VTLLDVDEGVPVAAAATTVGKGGEVACARKLLRSDQVALENTTLIDSLHTNATNAHLIVSVRGANYIAAIKDNQPTLHQLAQKQLADTPPFFESRTCQWLLNTAPDSGGAYRSRRSGLSPRSTTR
jgi:hypothetical protein